MKATNSECGMTIYELNVAIARMMPGWEEVAIGIEHQTWDMVFTIYPRLERVSHWIKGVEREWSPATDLNQAAEAVRAIVGENVEKNEKFTGRAWAAVAKEFPSSVTHTVGFACLGPRAWCLALVAMRGAK